MLFQFEDFELDPPRFELRRAGSPIPIPRLVFDLIFYLLQHRDRPVTKAELFEHVWPGRTVTEASLSQAITAARRALSDTVSEQRVIKTVHGRGYWWVAETRVARSAEERRRADPFVGRETELSLAVEAFEQVRRGASLLLRVVGEAGIGKTRLADEVALAAKGHGFAVFRGRCPETGGEVSTSPWHDVLSQALLSDRDSRSVELTLPASRLDLLEQVPTALRSHLERMPILIIIDDVHRIDRLSLRLALAMLRECASSPLMLLTTHRESSESAAREAMRELAEVVRARTVELRPLRLREIEQLVEHATGGLSRIDPALVYDRSGGNPFFATELVRALQSEEFGAERGKGSTRLPYSIRDAVYDQTKRLSQGSLDLLRLASVVGREFEVSFVTRVAGLTVSRVLESLEELLAPRLVEQVPDRPGRFRFRHLLVRDSVYAQLSFESRGRIHLAIAAEIRARQTDRVGPHLLPLAHHLRSALPLGDASDVAQTCLGAARYATQSLEPAAAVECCLDALGLLEGLSCLSLDTRVDLSIALAVAEMRCGLRKEGRQTLKKLQAEACVSDRPDLAARAALSLAPGFFAIETGVVDWDLIGTLEQALGALSASDSITRVRLLGSLAQALYWSEDRMRVEALVRDATAVATRLDADAGLAYAELARFGARWGPDTLDERSRLSGGVWPRTEALGDAEVEMMSRVFSLTTLLELGQRRLAETELGNLRRIALNGACVHGRWYPPMYDAMLAITGGRFADAEALIHTYRSIGQHLDDVNVAQTSLLQMTEILWQTGRASAVIGAVEENIEKHPALHEWQGALVFLNARAGRVREAREGLDALAGRQLPGLSYRMNAVIGVAALAEAAWLVDHGEAAWQLRSRLERWGERVIVAGYGVLSWGAMARGRGHLASLLGEGDEAEFWYRRALSLEGRNWNFVWRARTQIAYAKLLRARAKPGDATKADRLLWCAQRFAEMRGLSSLAAEAASVRERRLGVGRGGDQ